MKKGAILLAAAVLLCAALTACGMQDTENGTTETSDREAEMTSSTERSFGDTVRDDRETVSEMFSEGFSELRENSFLDPQNGIISDTQPD